MKLTAEQEAFKVQIADAMSVVSEADRKLMELMKSCKHVFRESAMKRGSAECMICGVDFGWYCKKSPDHVCHYESEDGQVELLDGTLVPVPEGHDASHENGDWCVFCNEPADRA